MKKNTKKQAYKREYSWVSGSQYKMDATSVGLEVERLLVENEQKLGAPQVVEAARDPLSPIHGAFEWDDTKAAEEHRLHQARKLLQSIQVTILTPKGGEVTTRLTVTTETVNPRKRQYTSTEYALADTELRAEVLKQALRELAAFRRRYAELSELSMVFAAIEKTRKQAA